MPVVKPPAGRRQHAQNGPASRLIDSAATRRSHSALFDTVHLRDRCTSDHWHYSTISQTATSKHWRRRASFPASGRRPTQSVVAAGLASSTLDFVVVDGRIRGPMKSAGLTGDVRGVLKAGISHVRCCDDPLRPEPPSRPPWVCQLLLAVTTRVRDRCDGGVEGRAPGCPRRTRPALAGNRPWSPS